ncbi:multifunctional CCA addition/repair protein [Paucibacter sp. DJ2R-2]|uniref:multifunctional CCA addition/repair protein n=1 Tax=Paucibacter sp. DJ2R-2 TaxID=2893558 RepID=UPI0029623560|nr:multifunctional CCA addition/repair protein [Paucibacter sp. DJ2R-2]
MTTMKSYLVGGAVRDALLGWPVKDRDWVVVGADPAAMRAAGYQAVGRDFPVFLHPETHEEYALARTERKTAPGYHGFAFHASPDVTLEQDLARRDLTINAMAQDASGQIIDPYGGQRDLAARVLRHVSPAFAEDPVRILRLARFAARFEGFTVAPETLALMRAMVAAGEVDALVAERVWQEFAKGLMEAQPARMIEVLRDCGALARLAPELEALFGVPQPPAHHPEVDTGIHVLMVLQQCARQQAPLTVRYASLCHDLGKGLTPADVLPRHIGHESRSLPLVRRLSERWRVPSDCRELAELVAREHTHVHQSESFSPEARLRLMERCDAWRRPERFEQMLWACECDARGRLGLEDRPYPQRERLLQDLRAVQAVDLAAVSAQALAEGRKGPEIGRAVQRARLAALGE